MEGRASVRVLGMDCASDGARVVGTGSVRGRSDHLQAPEIMQVHHTHTFAVIIAHQYGCDLARLHHAKGFACQMGVVNPLRRLGTKLSSRCR